MNFKRPCWLALYIALGMLLLGYCGFLTTASYLGDKTTGGWWWFVIGNVVYLLVILGAFGTVVSLLWCFVEAVVSRGHSDRPKS